MHENQHCPVMIQPDCFDTGLRQVEQHPPVPQPSSGSDTRCLSQVQPEGQILAIQRIMGMHEQGN